MNILFLADSFLPHAGGSRVYYYNLLKSLVAQFPDHVTVLTKKVPGWEEFDRRESGASLKISRSSRPLPDWKILQWPKIIFPFALAVREALGSRVDLAHVGDLYPQGVIGLALKSLFGLPYVAYSHGEEITQTDLRRYQPIVRDRIYREAGAVVAACEFARQRLLRIGLPQERVFKITPGVDCERFAPQAPQRGLIEKYDLQGKKVLLTVGRLCPRKGHDVVLRALARLAGQMQDVRYLIAGVGSEEDRLRRIVSDLGLTGFVKFAGYVPEDQLPEIYGLCDVFVMPNREERGDLEGFGMVFIEASAAGKPVVGGRSGGTCDSIADGVTGLLVDPQDDVRLADTLRRLLSNPDLRHRLGSAGMRRARLEFDWTTRARQLQGINTAVVERLRATTRTVQSLKREPTRTSSSR